VVPRLDELTGELAADGVTAAGFPADVTDRPALAAALRSTGALDITVDTTGGSSVTPAPVFVSAGMAGAALRKWAVTLNGVLVDSGIYVGRVAIGVWIAGTWGAPEGASPREPDDIARLYWGPLHRSRARRSPHLRVIDGFT
jgi:hypothetical protein